MVWVRVRFGDEASLEGDTAKRDLTRRGVTRRVRVARQIRDVTSA